MLGQAGKSSGVWSTAPHVVSIFSLWCLPPLLIPQHIHGHVELLVPSSLPAGSVIPVVDIKMPRQGHPPLWQHPLSGLSSHPVCLPLPTPSASLAGASAHPFPEGKQAEASPAAFQLFVIGKRGKYVFRQLLFFPPDWLQTC